MSFFNYIPYIRIQLYFCDTSFKILKSSSLMSLALET